MPNKKITTAAALIIIAASILLTAFTNEAKFFHVWYQLMLVAVIMLSMYMTMKDVFIIFMISSCVIWGLGFFDVINQMRQLIVETSVILLAGMALGVYELNYNKEKSSRDTILKYKKSEINGMSEKIAQLNRQNHKLTEDLKNMRKYFTN